MKNFIKIEDRNDLIKDSSSKAILNSDISTLNEYKMKKKQQQELSNQKNSINKLEEKVSKIEDKLDLIIQLLEKK